jgi:hypothetical protein
MMNPPVAAVPVVTPHVPPSLSDLTRDEHNRLVMLMSQSSLFIDGRARQVTLITYGLDVFTSRVNLEGSAHEYCVRLVQAVKAQGHLPTGESAMGLLLRGLRDHFSGRPDYLPFLTDLAARFED